MSKDNSKLRAAIRKINEDLGKHRVKHFKGGGASQGNYVHAERKGLGDTDPFDIDVVPKEKTKKKKSVKVSKAFLDLDEIDNKPQEVYTEEEPKKLRESGDDVGTAWNKGYIFPMAEIRGPNSLVPYKGTSKDFYVQGRKTNTVRDTVNRLSSPDIIWREGDPYLYRVDLSQSLPIQVVGGPSEKNVGKKFALHSQVGRNLAKDRYSSKPPDGEYSYGDADDVHAQLKEKISSGGQVDNKVDTAKTNPDRNAKGAVSFVLANLHERKEQSLKIQFPNDTFENTYLTLGGVDGKPSMGKKREWSVDKDKIIFTFENAKFDTIEKDYDSKDNIVTKVELVDTGKTVPGPDGPTPIQDIEVTLQGAGEVDLSSIAWKAKATPPTLTILFEASKPLPAVKDEDKNNVVNKDKKQNVYKGRRANVWKSKIKGNKALDKDMKDTAMDVGSYRFAGRPWKNGIKNIIILTSDSKPPSTATNNIVRYVLDGVKIANPKFAGKVGNMKKPSARNYVAASRWLIKNGYLSFTKLDPVANRNSLKALQTRELGPSGQVAIIPKGKDRRLKRQQARKDRRGLQSEGVEDIDFDNISKPAAFFLDKSGDPVALGPDDEETFNFKSDDTDQSDKTEIDINTDINIPIDADVKSRVLKISAATGIKQEAIYGIEMTESSGRVNGLAFNDQIFRAELKTSEEHELADDIGIKKTSRPSPRYESNAKSTFNKAYEINPEAAIKASAWGLYQVLGRTSLPVYGNNPDAFLAAFKSNPMEHSVRSFIAWVKDRGSGFINAINNDKHRTWIKMYYGPKAFEPGVGGVNYVERYVRAKNRWSRI